MKSKKIAIIGLGYVGLPLAVEFGKKRKVIGYDIDLTRIEDLKNGFDKTKEVSNKNLKAAKNLDYTNNINDLKKCKIFIITVPTPIDKNMKPDLTFLIKASKSVGSILKKDNIVIYESTVYPGATEEVCVPILEKESGLTFNKGFYCGYSPERINPGDKIHNLKSIKKVIAGSTPQITAKINKLYKEIITAGTHIVNNIRIAEAAKVIENTQRDLNIALINEFAIIFNKLNINTQLVLEAASTKWNFLPFKPGLVGGHCIGVDPYYLAHKSLEAGYKPNMILSGRKLNNSMSSYIANQVICLLKNKNNNINDLNILIMGFTFKENCPDIRNTQIFKLYKNLKKFKFNVDVYEPNADSGSTKKEYNINLIDKPLLGKYHAIIVAVAHNEFKKLSISQIRKLGKKNVIVYDIKSMFDPSEVDGSL